MRILMIIGMTALLVTACTDDENPNLDPIWTGEILVDAIPDSIDAGWVISGPNDYEKSGTGDGALSNLSPGEYSVAWDDVAGFTTPENVTRVLAPGQTVTFAGDYAFDPAAYSIVIQVVGGPDDAPWSLWELRRGFRLDGNGSTTLTDLEPGEYTIAWNRIRDFIEPEGETVTVPGTGLVLVGEYRQGCSLSLPFPGTEDQLMANMRTVYENMETYCYEGILDPDFKMYLQQSTIDAFSLPRDFFDYEQDLAIARNMFSGEAPNENTPGITNIVFTTLTGIETWEDSQDPRFPDARFRTYNVLFIFEQGSGTTRRDMTVEGRIDFYLSSELVMHEGVERTMYRMVGQVDDTSARAEKPNEDVSWGSVKALFR